MDEMVVVVLVLVMQMMTAEMKVTIEGTLHYLLQGPVVLTSSAHRGNGSPSSPPTWHTRASEITSRCAGDAPCWDQAPEGWGVGGNREMSYV